MNRRFLILFFLLSLLRCSSNQSTLRENNSSLTDEEIKSDPHYPLAEALNGELMSSATEHSRIQIAQKECEKTQSPLCSILKHLKTFKKIQQQKNSIYTPQLTRPLAPIVPVFHQGKISNWPQLRKSPVANLLKGFLALDKEQLLLLGLWLPNKRHVKRRRIRLWSLRRNFTWTL